MYIRSMNRKFSLKSIHSLRNLTILCIFYVFGVISACKRATHRKETRNSEFHLRIPVYSFPIRWKRIECGTKRARTVPNFTLGLAFVEMMPAVATGRGSSDSFYSL